jgi:hypothetical protein
VPGAPVTLIVGRLDAHELQDRPDALLDVNRLEHLGVRVIVLAALAVQNLSVELLRIPGWVAIL